MALTAEQIQEQLEAYFDSDEGKAYIDNITANISDEYTESEGGGPGTGNFVGYGDISLEDWQKQNIVTDGNNNTSLSNDQLTPALYIQVLVLTQKHCKTTIKR